MSNEYINTEVDKIVSDKNMPVSEISRYLATESPREEFSAHICTLLGARETAELQQRVDATLRGLRIDVKTCAEQIESRLNRPKAFEIWCDTTSGVVPSFPAMSEVRMDWKYRIWRI